MKKIFISFGAGSSNYHDAVKRIIRQASSFQFFDQVIGYTETDLKKDLYFWERHQGFIQQNPRGYGYWIWKPYLILRHLREMNEGDVLMYCDSGCELNIKQKNKFLDIFKKLDSRPVVATLTLFEEYMYTKEDLLDYLSCDAEARNSKQIQATCIIIKKNDDTLRLFDSMNTICENNYHLIDDSPSSKINHEKFREHRHDQSLFSIMIKKTNLLVLDSEYILDLPRFRHFGNFHASPIVLMRNRSGLSQLSLLAFSFYRISLLFPEKTKILRWFRRKR